jgi:hypothetical protein
LAPLDRLYSDAFLFHEGPRRAMTLSRMYRPWRRQAFSVGAWLVAFLYLFVAGGVPLRLTAPASLTAPKDVSRPFPCMNRPCGCQNADQCWRSCCCHTKAERMAWARARGVEPPIDQVAASPDETSETASRPRSCCSKRSSSELHDWEGGKRIVVTLRGQTRSQYEPVSESTSVLVLIQAVDCQGIGLQWLGGCVVTPPAIAEYWPELPPSGRLVLAARFSISSPAFPPPVPPPRVGTA